MKYEDKVEADKEVCNFADELGELDETLKDFRLSVQAWSEAAYNRPRSSEIVVARNQIWRPAVGWALGCVLIAGGVSAEIYSHHREQMKVVAARAVEQQRLAAIESSLRARQEDEDLLAKVDSDVSREVPSAMEPLAQMMAADETQ
ncbi:MAG: hypothetical protein ABSF70_07250 [Terracidiphilus sp.]|jgi:hypothetical protein